MWRSVRPCVAAALPSMCKAVRAPHRERCPHTRSCTHNPLARRNRNVRPLRITRHAYWLLVSAAVYLVSVRFWQNGNNEGARIFRTPTRPLFPSFNAVHPCVRIFIVTSTASHKTLVVSRPLTFPGLVVGGSAVGPYEKLSSAKSLCMDWACPIGQQHHTTQSID